MSTIIPIRIRCQPLRSAGRLDPSFPPGADIRRANVGVSRGAKPQFLRICAPVVARRSRKRSFRSRFGGGSLHARVWGFRCRCAGSCSERERQPVVRPGSLVLVLLAAMEMCLLVPACEADLTALIDASVRTQPLCRRLVWTGWRDSPRPSLEDTRTRSRRAPNCDRSGRPAPRS